MIQIDLYGPNGSSYEYVKMMLQKGLKNSSVSLNINDHHLVEDFIEAGIGSVPAVYINHRVLFEKHHKEHMNGFIRKVIQSILKEVNYGNMKKIVIPIDFSDSSNNAIYFAKNLAEYFNSVINLVHVYHPNPVDVQGQVFIDKELEMVYRDRFDTLVDSLNQDWIGDFMGSSLVDGSFIIGFPVPEIVRISKQENVEFIVMGSQGEDYTFKKLFGSISAEVAQKSYSPVFIVPPDQTFKPFKNILYATNDADLDSQCLLLTIKLANVFGSTIHLVNVSSNGIYQSDIDLLQLMRNRYPKAKIEHTQIEHSSVIEGINTFAKEIPIDLIAMATRHRSFWANLFHRSSTKAMAIATDIPLLVFHEGDQL